MCRRCRDAGRAKLDRSAQLAQRWTTLASLELRELAQSLLQQIQIGDDQVLMLLNRTAIVSSVIPDAALNPRDRLSAFEPFVLSITASLRRAGKGVRLVIGDGAAKAIDQGPGLSDRPGDGGAQHALVRP
jgi:hypothetical protein